MYESFFGLSEPPFSLSPDPRFLWRSDAHQEGLAVLLYGILQRKGFILLTGEIGAGKTTLLHAALAEVPRDLDTALVFNTADLGPIDLLKLVAAEFRLEGPFESKADFLIAFNRYLLARLEAGEHAVLIIDEAQNLSPAVLEEVRLLSNLETDRAKLLHIVLSGQPELRAKLADPSLVQLRQRVAIEHHVSFLGRDEIAPYLAHRIAVAGGQIESVFAPGFEEVFHDFSGGCPRLLNVLADRVLIAAFSQEVRPVPPGLIERKAKEMAEAGVGFARRGEA